MHKGKLTNVNPPRITTEPFKHLLNKYRIGYAKQLISNEVHSPNELYKPCGFSSRSAFYAAFKKIMRVSPLYYQKYYKDKQI